MNIPWPSFASHSTLSYDCDDGDDDDDDDDDENHDDHEAAHCIASQKPTYKTNDFQSSVRKDFDFIRPLPSTDTRLSDHSYVVMTAPTKENTRVSSLPPVARFRIGSLTQESVITLD